MIQSRKLIGLDEERLELMKKKLKMRGLSNKKLFTYKID